LEALFFNNLALLRNNPALLKIKARLLDFGTSRFG